jgi:branched-chain amino acid transport system substrate-binding protein
MKRPLATISFLFFLFICTSSGAPPALCKTLTVANIHCISGPGAAWGINSDRGLRMCVEEINGRGGLRVGKEIYTIQVVTMDHRYQPGEALAAAKKAVHDGIKFVFSIGGGVMPAVQPVLEENKVMILGQFGRGRDFTNPKYPYTFRVMPSTELVYMLFLPEIVKIWGPIKGGFIYNNDEQGRSDEVTVRKVTRERNLPIEQVFEFVERDSIDFSPVVTRLMAKGVNLITCELQPAQAATFFKQAWDLGYKGRMGRIFAPYILETFVQTAGKEALEGFISGTNWPPGQHPSAKYEKFRSKYLSVYKEEPIGNAFWSHAGMEFLAIALEKAGTTDPERVVKIMYDLKTETVLGPTHMVGKTLGYGINTQMSYAIPFCELRDGQFKLIKVLQYKE